jgi:hypothetical protein
VPDTTCVVVADTPFQVLVSTMIFASPEAEKYGAVDLVLMDQFNGCESYARLARESGLFRTVAVVPRYYGESSHFGTSYLLNSTFRAGRARRAFDAAVGHAVDGPYDVLYCSCSTQLSLDAKKYLVPSGETVFYDDGTGSHSGGVFKAFSCFDRNASKPDLNRSATERVKAAVRNIVCHAMPASWTYNVSKMLLVNPSEETKRRLAPYRVEAVQVPANMGELFSSMVPADVFDAYKRAKFIYFTLPGNVSEQALAIEMDIVRELQAAHGLDLSIKVHPRRPASDFNGMGLDVLPDANWEILLFMGAISDGTTLGAVCSTTQYAPKLLMDLEPRCEFYYKRFENTDIQTTSAQTIVEDMLASYAHKDRLRVLDA